jgi:hypothetical protein
MRELRGEPQANALPLQERALNRIGFSDLITFAKNSAKISKRVLD